ncbi:MAG: pyruvate kinase [Patescibacteria group bacterium]
MIRTKIVGTIGPASEKISIMKQMIVSGMDAARLNFSHNAHSHHLVLIRNLRKAAEQSKRSIAIMADLQGPRIRIGDVGEGVSIKKNQETTLFFSNKKFQKGKGIKIPVHYDLSRDIKPGAMVLIDDALIKLKVKKIVKKEIICEALTGGLVKTHKGMNFPGSVISADPLTAKDLKDLEFAVKNRVDYIAMSFVKDEKDISRLRKKILNLEKKFNYVSEKAKEPRTKIIAKIESKEAVKNFDSILSVSDSIMVARGDLGIELPFEDVPLIQKKIVSKCNLAAKPVIVATQMLDSMIRNPLPTRAEVSDVANAILDGADAIMLSGESAAGKYPLLSVKTMNRIAKELEPEEFKVQQSLENKLKKVNSPVERVAFNAQDMAEKMKAKAILCLTKTGHTARLISRYKSKIPIFAFTENETVRNQLNLVWGVMPCQSFFSHTYARMARTVMNRVKELKKGDPVIVCAGRKFHYFKGKENYLKQESV